MTSKHAWRTAAVLGTLALFGYAGFVLIRTTPFDTASQAQMQGMPGMEHDPEAPRMPGAAPEAAMEHEAGEPEMAGHDMSPVDISAAPAAGPDVRGGQLLEAKEIDGIKEFELSTSVVRWHILPDVEVGAYAYNGQVPGPTIRVRPGDRVRIKVSNALPAPTTVHWHGFILPVAQDGVPELSQPPIPPGGAHVYEFDVPETPGTYFYPHPLQRRSSAAARTLRRFNHR